MKSENNNLRERIKTQIVINNSGIVLLGPFLEVLFSKLNLLEGRIFKDISAQKKAILSLHFAVTGQSKMPENEDFSLLKILCGLYPDEIIEIDIELTIEDEKLIESLLENVIKRWGTIKTTSISGFRETFLQRSGDLTEDKEAYVLLIDKKPFDVLLESVPWSYKSLKIARMLKLVVISW